MNNIAIRSLVNSEYLLKTVSTQYDLQNINSCRLLKFGGSNDIFLLTSAKKEFILKIFFKRQCWQYNENHYLFELELQQYLNQHDISASKPIANKFGKLIGKILLAEGERFFAVYEFEKGNKWDHTLTKDRRFYKLGETIAKLHSLSAKFCSTTDTQRKLDINSMLDKSWNDIDHLVILPSKKIKQELYNIYLEIKLTSKCFIKTQDLILIHGDVHGGNHLYDPKTKTITLLDFELCGHGLIGYELSVLKYDLINNHHTKKFTNTVMEEFLNGYSSINNQQLEQKLINFFVKVRYFFMLGSSFLFYPDKAGLNNTYILETIIENIKKAEQYDL